MKILQPPNWPRPKGYSNGISARGRMIFTAGVVGWDERESFPEYTLHGQFARLVSSLLRPALCFGKRHIQLNMLLL